MTSKKEIEAKKRSTKLIKQIAKLNKEELLALYETPELFLMDYQVPPTNNWRYHLFCGGRGTGKSYTGLVWLLSKIKQGAKRLAIVGPDFNTVENVLVNEFLALFPPGKQPTWNTQSKIISYPDDPNTWVIYVYTSTADIRGPNIEYCFCDEIVKWCDQLPDKIQERFNVMDFAVRIGDNPQIFIASTPKPIGFFKKFFDQFNKGNPRYSLKVASLHQNPHLSDDYKAAILDKYEGTRFGAQEIDGIVSFDIQGALWTPQLLELTRARIIPISQHQHRQSNPLHFFDRRIIAIDPANTINEDSDDTGIVVAGLGEDGHGYVLETISKKLAPLELATLIKDKYQEYDCDAVVVEVNNGGLFITDTLRAAFKHKCPYIKTITAFESKLLRARPVVALHEQERIHLVGLHTRLEDELCNYDGDPKRKSPNLLDAFVYALQELLIDPQAGSVSYTDILYNLPMLG